MSQQQHRCFFNVVVSIVVVDFSVVVALTDTVFVVSIIHISRLAKTPEGSVTLDQTRMRYPSS